MGSHIFIGGIFISLICLILSGALYSSYYGLLVAVPYFLIPIAGSICSSMAANGSANSGWAQFGYFMESMLWVTCFGIPSVCWHVQAMNAAQFGWVMAANVGVLVSFIGYARSIA